MIVVLQTLRSHGCRGAFKYLRLFSRSVSEVLDMLASGLTPLEILHDFPDLNIEDIRACIEFAADRDRDLFGE